MTETKTIDPEKKVEPKFPQIGTEIRGHYYVYTKDRGTYQWTFPYQTTHEESLANLDVIKVAIEKTIEERKTVEKDGEFAKAKEEKKVEIPVKTK